MVIIQMVGLSILGSFLAYAFTQAANAGWGVDRDPVHEAYLRLVARREPPHAVKLDRLGQVVARVRDENDEAA